MYTYKTHGTCSASISFDVVDGRVKNVSFLGGCRGNTRGVARLAENMPVDEVIARLKGIECRNGTSCPNELAKALEEYKSKNSL